MPLRVLASAPASAELMSSVVHAGARATRPAVRQRGNPLLPQPPQRGLQVGLCGAQPDRAATRCQITAVNASEPSRDGLGSPELCSHGSGNILRWRYRLSGWSRDP